MGVFGRGIATPNGSRDFLEPGNCLKVCAHVAQAAFPCRQGCICPIPTAAVVLSHQSISLPTSP